MKYQIIHEHYCIVQHVACTIINKSIDKVCFTTTRCCTTGFVLLGYHTILITNLYYILISLKERREQSRTSSLNAGLSSTVLSLGKLKPFRAWPWRCTLLAHSGCSARNEHCCRSQNRLDCSNHDGGNEHDHHQLHVMIYTIVVYRMLESRHALLGRLVSALLHRLSKRARRGMLSNCAGIARTGGRKPACTTAPSHPYNRPLPTRRLTARRDGELGGSMLKTHVTF